ncbi:hypothetical protein D3C84_953830 [compost metagenome]
MNTRETVVRLVPVVDIAGELREHVVADDVRTRNRRLEHRINHVTAQCAQRIQQDAAVIRRTVLEEEIDQANVNINDPNRVRQEKAFHKRSSPIA